MAIERPDFVKDEHLEFLNNLRESSVTNMWGATPYIMKAYPEFDEPQADAILFYWMKTLKKG